MQHTTSPRPAIYRELVSHLSSLGFSFNARTGEFVNARTGERGRACWNCWEDEAWLRFPGTSAAHAAAQHYTVKNPSLRITREQMLAGGSGA